MKTIKTIDASELIKPIPEIIPKEFVRPCKWCGADGSNLEVVNKKVTFMGKNGKYAKMPTEPGYKWVLPVTQCKKCQGWVRCSGIVRLVKDE